MVAQPRIRTNYQVISLGDSPTKGKNGHDPHKKNHLLNNHYSIILDGEMIAYDPSVDGFLPFGTLKSTSVNDGGEIVESVDVNVDINDPTKPHPCCKLFSFFSGKFALNTLF